MSDGMIQHELQAFPDYPKKALGFDILKYGLEKLTFQNDLVNYTIIATTTTRIVKFGPGEYGVHSIANERPQTIRITDVPQSAVTHWVETPQRTEELCKLISDFANKVTLTNDK